MPNYTILVIDYDPRSIETLRAPLERVGYRVEVATDGQAGIRRFHEIHPDVTLIEPMLPKKHGFEVCQELKASPHGERSAIFIVTSVYKAHRYRYQARSKYGCDEFLEKPVADEVLLEAVMRYVPIPGPQETGTDETESGDAVLSVEAVDDEAPAAAVDPLEEEEAPAAGFEMIDPEPPPETDRPLRPDLPEFETVPSTPAARAVASTGAEPDSPPATRPITGPDAGNPVDARGAELVRFPSDTRTRPGGSRLPARGGSGPRVGRASTATATARRARPRSVKRPSRQAKRPPKPEHGGRFSHEQRMLLLAAFLLAVLGALLAYTVLN